MRLTSPLNLPAPGRRQCVYVGLENALAHTCVFAKQSLDAILCGLLRLESAWLSHLTKAPLLPKLRGHFAEFLLRKSLEHLRLLASPTCVGLRYGHRAASPAKLFLAVGSAIPWRGLAPPSASVLGYPEGFASPETPTALHRNPPRDGYLAPASLLELERTHGGTGILTRFPSATPFGLALGTD